MRPRSRHVDVEQTSGLGTPLSKFYAHQMWRIGSSNQPCGAVYFAERLDTFFFSCLGLAKSAHNIIKDDQGGRYRDAIHSWKMNALDIKGRTRFNGMMRLRDIDVHQGKSGGKTLPTMIPVDRDLSGDAWMYQQRTANAALGVRPIATEHTNPDGKTVSSFDGLQSSRGLYVELASETCDAADACEQFIAQLRDLVTAMSASDLPPLSRLQRFELWLKAKFGIRD